MSDDVLGSAVSHGLALVAGGGTSGIVMRLLFGGFLKRLDDIESTLRQLVDKSDKRHEDMLERISRIESKADAAHTRIDSLPGGRRRR